MVGCRIGGGNGAGGRGVGDLSRGGASKRGGYPHPFARDRGGQARGRGGCGRGGRLDRKEQQGNRGRGRGGRGIGGRIEPATNAPVNHTQVQAETKKRAAEDRDDDARKKQKEVLSCDICNENHLTSACTIYLRPKSHASFCGYAGEGGFFQVPFDGTTGKLHEKRVIQH